MVRAKFKCFEKKPFTATRVKVDEAGNPVLVDGKKVFENYEVQTVRLIPVEAGGNPIHENAQFWAATPSGLCELGCVNLAAADKFEVGKEYYLDFTPTATQTTEAGS